MSLAFAYLFRIVSYGLIRFGLVLIMYHRAAARWLVLKWHMTSVKPLPSYASSKFVYCGWVTLSTAPPLIIPQASFLLRSLPPSLFSPTSNLNDRQFCQEPSSHDWRLLRSEPESAEHETEKLCALSPLHYPHFGGFQLVVWRGHPRITCLSSWERVCVCVYGCACQK